MDKPVPNCDYDLVARLRLEAEKPSLIENYDCLRRAADEAADEIERLGAEVDDHRAILNRIADAVGHPRIAPGEDADSVAASVEDNVRHLHQLEEAYDAVKPPNDSLTLNVASLEHHAEHHERERGLNAEIERLKVVADDRDLAWQCYHEVLQQWTRDVDLRRVAEAEQKQWNAAVPPRCPITNETFFMLIEHPDLGWVPTYGGPFDSYTIPQRDTPDDDETPLHRQGFSRCRYDHDEDCWVEGCEDIGLSLIDEDDLYELEGKVEALAADRDALRRLIVQPWVNEEGATLWKVNLAWFDTGESEEEAWAIVAEQLARLEKEGQR